MNGSLRKNFKILLAPLIILCVVILSGTAYSKPDTGNSAQNATQRQTNAKSVKNTKSKNAPAKAKTANKNENNQDSKNITENSENTQTSSNIQSDDDITFEDEEKPSQKTQASTESNPVMSLINQYGVYALIIIGILIILIIFLALSKGSKNKSACSKCGRKVLPGNDLCDACKNSEMLLSMESNAPSFQQPFSPADKFYMPQQSPEPMPSQPQHQSSPLQQASAVETKKKTRPSGRVIATITIRKGDNAGYRFNYYESQNQISIGKDPECDFVLESEDDKELASRHAIISLADNSVFTVHDMSAGTGIQVNGEYVKQAQLKSGDVIKISKIELTFARL